jgi:hypothetical protein
VTFFVQVDEILYQWVQLLDVEQAVSIEVQLLKERLDAFLELSNFLLELLLLLLSHLVNEVVELQCLLIINTHDLVGG